MYETRKWKKILAGILVMVFLALELCLASRMKTANSVPGEAAYTPAAGQVTLYDVQTVNARPRPMAAVETGVVADERAGLTFRGVQLDDIPLLEVFQDDGAEKPLLLFLHGLGQSKESVLPALTAFARAGYYAVSMDAYDHGRRAGQTECDNWAAMLITVADIDQVAAYYETQDNVNAVGFVLGGFSMGGVEACAYAQLGEHTPGALLAVSGVCDTAAWQQSKREKLYSSWLTASGPFVTAICHRQTADYTAGKYAAIESMNITAHLQSYKDIPIFCCVGTADTYFNADAAGETVAAIAAAGNESAVFKSYNGQLHRLTGEMIFDCLDFLRGLGRSLSDI